MGDFYLRRPLVIGRKTRCETEARDRHGAVIDAGARATLGRRASAQTGEV